jgi:ankyrin repeat protein
MQKMNLILSKEIEEAVKQNDVDFIRQELDNGLDINDKTLYGGSTMLKMASYQGKTDIVKLLVERGVDINFTYNLEYDNSALTLATEKSHKDIVKLLIENGADINYQNWHHASALYFAVKNGDIHIVNYLLEHGADINIKIYQNENILTQAIKNGHNEIIKLLLEKGSEFMLFNFDTAVEKCSIEVIELLIDKGGDIHQCDYKNTSVLAIAVEKEDIELVKFFIQKGVSINTQDKYGYTPLMLSIKHDSFEIFSILVNSGADLNAQNKELNNQTALDMVNERMSTDEEFYEPFVELLQKYNAQTRRHTFDENSVIKLFKIIEHFGNESEGEEKTVVGFVEDEDLAKEYVEYRRDGYKKYLETDEDGGYGAFTWGYYFIEYFPFEPRIASSLKEIKEFSYDLYEDMEDYENRIAWL